MKSLFRTPSSRPHILTLLALFLLSIISLHYYTKSSTGRNEKWDRYITDKATPDDEVVWTYYEQQPLAVEGPLSELGWEADNAYNFGPQASTWLAYLHTLSSFIITSLPSTLSTSLLEGTAPYTHPYLLPSFHTTKKGELRAVEEMVRSKVVWQTDKNEGPEEGRWLKESWRKMNKGWEYRFLNDSQAQALIETDFKGSDIEWAWNFMPRPVLKADFLRYILPMYLGGLYSDVDTECRKPIEDWGNKSTAVEYYAEGVLKGVDYGVDRWWKRGVPYKQPSVIVGVDVDVHVIPNYLSYWPRPLGLCQWTLSSAPNHPIFIDAVRRVVNATQVVHDREVSKAKEVQKLEAELASLALISDTKPELFDDDGESTSPSSSTPPSSEQENARLALEAQLHAAKSRSTNLPVMEWTGPGLFSDAVLSYLLARYNVPWTRLRKLTRPLRIGEVLVLPITGLSPNGQADFHAESPDSPQNCIVHHFRGSWMAGGF